MANMKARWAHDKAVIGGWFKKLGMWLAIGMGVALAAAIAYAIWNAVQRNKMREDAKRREYGLPPLGAPTAAPTDDPTNFHLGGGMHRAAQRAAYRAAAYRSPLADATRTPGGVRVKLLP